MTGLKKNILSLQGDNRISFLKRAEKIELMNLNIRAIKLNYEKNLNIPEEKAVEMAQLTKGYSYAFDIIWDDLSAKEKEVLKAIVNSPTLTTKDILASSNLDSNTYNEYRNILITKGIIKSIGYGEIDIILPRFAEIAKEQLRIGLWR